MSPKERYWQLFDRGQALRALPPGFTDQAGLFAQEVFRLNQELQRITDIPTDLPDLPCLSPVEKDRIDKEAKDIHWALNYPSTGMPQGFLEATCSRINQNSDACFVYNRLPRRDQERLQLQVERDRFGKPVYVLQVPHTLPRTSYQTNVQNWMNSDGNPMGGH